MNPQERLHSWASQWSARQLLSADPPSPPEPPSPASQASSSQFAVGFGDLASRLLTQLNASITPDDAQRAQRDGAFTVSATGVRTPNVPILRGQIRQLNPELKPSWTRTVIVLLLSVEDSAGRVLAVPFGEFSEPAFDSELSTGLTENGMAVLCVWNAAWVPLGAMKHSWWLMDAFDDLLRDVELMHKLHGKREALTVSLLDRAGLPILHPLDPRHDYLDLEAGLLEDLNFE